MIAGLADEAFPNTPESSIFARAAEVSLSVTGSAGFVVRYSEAGLPVRRV